MKVLTSCLVTAVCLAASANADIDSDGVEMQVELALDSTFVDGTSLALDELLEAHTTLLARDHTLEEVTVTARGENHAALALRIDGYETPWAPLSDTDAGVWHERSLAAPVSGPAHSWRLVTQGTVTVESVQLALRPLETTPGVEANAPSNTYMARIRRGPLDRRRWRPAPVVAPVAIDRPAVSLTFVSSRYRGDRYRSGLARRLGYYNDPYWTDPFRYPHGHTTRVIRQPIVVTTRAHDRRGVRQRDRNPPPTTVRPRREVEQKPTPRARVPRNRAEQDRSGRDDQRRTRRGIPVRER